MEPSLGANPSAKESIAMKTLVRLICGMQGERGSRRGLAAAFLILVFFVFTSIGAQLAHSLPKKYNKETKVQVSPNSQFKISAGWTFDDSTKLLVSPEGDVKIFLIEKKAIGDLDSLALATWKDQHPQFHFPVLRANSFPPQDGWESAREIFYELPVQEKRTLSAFIRTFQGTAYILLLDASHAGLSKRSAQLGIVEETWHPPGIVKEDLNHNKVKLFAEADAHEMDRFIYYAMNELSVPGAAVAVIQNNRDVYRKGFGVKKLGGPPVSRYLSLNSDLT